MLKGVRCPSSTFCSFPASGEVNAAAQDSLPVAGIMNDSGRGAMLEVVTEPLVSDTPGAGVFQDWS